MLKKKENLTDQEAKKLANKLESEGYKKTTVALKTSIKPMEYRRDDDRLHSNTEPRFLIVWNPGE